MMTSPRVGYIWSKESQHVADCLPANPGRSSLVHGLIHTLDLLEEGDAIPIDLDLLTVSF